MNINLDLYRYFFYVCEFKSITKAANYLYLTQPAISKQIKQLETKLGQKLITKSKHGIEITEIGQKLYNDIKDSIEILNSIESKFQRSESKYEITIKIIAGHLTTKNVLLNTIAKMNKSHPTIKFEIMTYPYEEAIKKLHQGESDLIICCLEEVQEVPTNISIKKLIDIHDVLVVGKELKKEIPSKINILDLDKYPIIGKTEFSVVKSFIEKYFEDNNKVFIPTYQLKNNWLIEEYVKRNLGIGVLTKEYIEKELQEEVLNVIDTDIPLPSKELACAYRNNSPNYEIIKEIIKQLINDIKIYN